MWTAEEDRQLTENWKRAEAKRKEEALAYSRKLAKRVFSPLEMPPEGSTPSYPDTGRGPETSIEMLRRANSGTCDGRVTEQPLTQAEMGMSQREFDALRPDRQLAIANAAFFRRMSST